MYDLCMNLEGKELFWKAFVVRQRHQKYLGLFPSKKIIENKSYYAFEEEILVQTLSFQKLENECMIDCSLECDNVFSLEDDGGVTCVGYATETSDHSLIQQLTFSSYSYCLFFISTLQNDAELMQKSSSPWTSPVVMVWKKDNTLRFCVNYWYQKEYLSTAKYIWSAWLVNRKAYIGHQTSLIACKLIVSYNMLLKRESVYWYIYFK